MHALEWIAQHGRYLRSINAAQLRRSLGRAKRTCTWCGEPVSKGRSTWCSKACVEAFQQRCSPVYVRHHIERTRPLVCAICGADLAWLKRTLDRPRRAWMNIQHREDLCPASWTIQVVNRRSRRNRQRQQRWAALWSPVACYAKIRQWAGRRGISTVWEADHIVPVIEGGGLCGPEGYRILCRCCHAKQTAALAVRRSAKRKPKPRHRQLEFSDAAENRVSKTLDRRTG